MTYASLYAAYVDLHLHDNEIQWMSQRFGEGRYHSIHDEFITQSEFANLRTIQEHKEIFFPGEQGTEELLASMKELFQVDGDYSTLEKISFSFLRNYL